MTLEMKNQVSNWTLVLLKKKKKKKKIPKPTKKLKHIKHNVDKPLFKSCV